MEDGEDNPVHATGPQPDADGNMQEGCEANEEVIDCQMTPLPDREQESQQPGRLLTSAYAHNRIDERTLEAAQRPGLRRHLKHRLHLGAWHNQAYQTLLLTADTR